MAQRQKIEWKTPFLTVEEAADWLRIKTRTLDNMRWRGEGPHWRKHGGTVVYHIDDVKGWSRENDFGYGPGYDANQNDPANDDGVGDEE